MKLEENKEDWLVLKTRHNAEKKACLAAQKAGYKCFMPEYTSFRQWSDRIKKLKRPLIPSTLFIKTNPGKYHNLYTLPLVTGILKEFGKPAIVRDFEIKNLEIIAREFNGENVVTADLQYLKKGDQVRVTRGQFKNIEGILIRKQGQSRLIVEVSALTTAFEINLPACQVEKIAT